MAHLKPVEATRSARPAELCPVADIALESQRLIDAMIAAEEAKLTATEPEARWRHEHRHDVIYDLLEVRRDTALVNRATSSAGALHQLAIASALTEHLWELTPDEADNRADHFKAKELLGLIKWALYSVAGVLEQAASAPRDRLAVEYYMIESADPFAVTALAEGGAA